MTVSSPILSVTWLSWMHRNRHSVETPYQDRTEYKVRVARWGEIINLIFETLLIHVYDLIWFGGSFIEPCGCLNSDSTQSMPFINAMINLF